MSRNPTKIVEDRYDHYVEKTLDPQTAAILALAETMEYQQEI